MATWSDARGQSLKRSLKSGVSVPSATREIGVVGGYFCWATYCMPGRVVASVSAIKGSS